MTVHMFRVFVGRGKMSVADLETRIDDWVDSNPEWVDDPVEHSLTEQNTAIDGSGTTFYAVDVRFRKDDTKSNLVQKLEDKLKNKVDWYRLGYHSCPHDESNAGPCSWDDRREWTAKDASIPPDIPNLTN